MSEIFIFEVLFSLYTPEHVIIVAYCHVRGYYSNVYIFVVDFLFGALRNENKSKRKFPLYGINQLYATVTVSQ